MTLYSSLRVVLTLHMRIVQTRVGQRVSYYTTFGPALTYMQGQQIHLNFQRIKKERLTI